MKKNEGGSISLSELSVEGQQAYNAIRDKIMNLSADLPISPMDAIRMKIEEAGYSVAEITGRTMQLNRTDDGKYIVEARKDRDKKAAMRDFNSGKLDVLMINKSGSTGISLHASSKFEDQRQRVMVFAQFQSDINDEVQMRGRIDRSGQVTRGRYEYIMSTIPAEQRMQMMFKAKLKSLDANTTSSQKSKFNEMEIVDYLNKYGDEVVWEYMKEHPELEERLGDPLEMLQEKNAEDGPRTSEKEDTSKKNGCAGKISRYLAFLSVEEQDEIFNEITDAYRVKIQLLDDAGENDLEITTMPLRAETKRKQMWHEGVNPGSGNAFADNTYVEEVEADVLKKPMKRAEIAEATKKLMGEHYAEKNGGVDWQHYVRAKGDEISQFFQAKADESVGKLKEAGEARIAKTREKAVSAATKARGRGENNFTDAEIQSLADAIANEESLKEEQKQKKRREEIMSVKNRIHTLLNRLRAEGIYVVPQDLKKSTAEMFSQTFGTFVGFKFNKSYTLGSSTAIFATLDGRRKVELALNDQAIGTIISATEIAYRYSPKEINAISMENWDSKVPTQTRQKRYIITGNLLQALVDTEKGEKTRGNLISYSTIDGETRQGILMSENFKLTDLRNSASFSSRLAQIREGKAVVSENGDVQIEKVAYGWQHRGDYELRVPKSKSRGGIYTMDKGLLKLVDGNNFVTKGNSMIGYVSSDNIAKVVDMLSRAPFNLTVLQESQLSDVATNGDGNKYRLVEDRETIDFLDNQPMKSGYRYSQWANHGVLPPMTAKKDGEWRAPMVFDRWEQSEEGMRKANGKADLVQGNGRTTGDVAYNPYFHIRTSPLNDQFTAAYDRPELLVIEGYYPESEETSGYRADGAKDSVGLMDWHSGSVNGQLSDDTKVQTMLSRYFKPRRIVPWSEVADLIMERVGDQQITFPINAVPPMLRAELARRGAKFGGISGSVSKEDIPMLEDLRDRVNRGEWNAGLEKARAYQDAYESSAEAKESRVLDLSDKLNTPVKLISSQEEIDALPNRRQRRAKGWWSDKDNSIVIVVPNNVNVADIENTFVHEVVGHKGLRALIGADRFDEFLGEVYDHASEPIRKEIDKKTNAMVDAEADRLRVRKAQEHEQAGEDVNSHYYTDMAEARVEAEKKREQYRKEATEEYMADMAGKIGNEGFEKMDREEQTLWGKIKAKVQQFLDKFLQGLKIAKSIKLTDKDLAYILFKSWKNMRGDKGVFAQAEDAVMRYRTGWDKSMESRNAIVEETNKRFNEELQQQIDGTLPEGHVYDMGMPSEYLLSTGIDNLPIKLSAKTLTIKSNLERHAYDLHSLLGLVKAIQKPWAIFSYGDKRRAQNLVIGVEDNGKQFIVGISIRPTLKGGRTLEINSVRNVFPKDNHEWINWINEGKLLRVDGKEEIQATIDKLRMNPMAFAYVNLDNAAKIVENFENPTLDDDKIVRYRDGDDIIAKTPVLARGMYEQRVASSSYQVREALQDSMLGLKEAYLAIEKASGRKQHIEDIAGFENAYLSENRMIS